MDRRGKKTRSQVKAIWFDLQNVGKRWKSSKQRYTWKISIDSKEHQIDLFVSKMSLKYRVVIDGNRVQMSKSLGSQFQYPFELDRHMLNIVQEQNNQYKLRIDNQDFQQLYMFQQMGDQQEDQHEEEPEEEQQDYQKQSKKEKVQSNKQDALNDYYQRNRGETNYDMQEQEQRQVEQTRQKSQTIAKPTQPYQQPPRQSTQTNQNKQDPFEDRQDLTSFTQPQKPIQQQQQQYQEPPFYQQQQQQQPQQFQLVQTQEQKPQKNIKNDLVGLWEAPQSSFTQAPTQETWNPFPQSQSQMNYQQQAQPTPAMQNVYSQENPQFEQHNLLQNQNFQQNPQQLQQQQSLQQQIPQQQIQQQQIPQQQTQQTNQQSSMLDFTSSPQESYNLVKEQPKQSAPQQNLTSDFDLLDYSGQTKNQPVQQNLPQKKEEKNKELAFLCDLDNLDNENESPANLKKKQQANKQVTIVPGNVPMKQLTGQTQNTQQFNMQGMQPQMNSMQQQQMQNMMMQQMMMSNNMNMMGQMNPMMSNNMNMNTNTMNPMMMQMFNTMMNQMNQGGMNQQGGGFGFR